MLRRGPRGQGGETAVRMRLGWTLVWTAGAVAALVAGSTLGNLHGHGVHPKVISASAAGLFLVLGVLAIRSVTGELSLLISARAGASAGSAVRLLASFVGYVVALFVGLGLLNVPVQHLLLGGALTGVVLGIALQQVLGNVFAGLVLLFVRPFVVGDRIRIRSGSLGGVLEGTVTSMGLTYVTLATADGGLNIPNASMLASAVGPAPEPSPASALSPETRR